MDRSGRYRKPNFFHPAITTYAFSFPGGVRALPLAKGSAGFTPHPNRALSAALVKNLPTIPFLPPYISI